ncbi:MAG: hypothetical protein ACK5JH_13955 [Anaerocolumna sp.]
MKKFGKFLFGTVSVATLACGAYYLYKNLVNKDSSDDFDDFEDDFEDFDTEDEDDFEPDQADTREYVSINITSEGLNEDSNTESSDESDDTESTEK